MKKQYIVTGDNGLSINARHVSAVSKKMIDGKRYCMIYLQNGRVIKAPDNCWCLITTIQKALNNMANGY